MQLTIAICEDVSAQRDYITALLQDWASHNGHTLHVSPFPTAERFLSAYEDGFRPDLLLLDIEMPGQSGMDLARRLRQIHDDTPIAFLTGYSDYMQEGYEVSALHYLLKPVSAQELSRVRIGRWSSSGISGNSCCAFWTACPGRSISTKFNMWRYCPTPPRSTWTVATKSRSTGLFESWSGSWAAAFAAVTVPSW